MEFVLNGVEASPSAVTIHRISQEVLYHLHLEKVSFCLHNGQNGMEEVSPVAPFLQLVTLLEAFRFHFFGMQKCPVGVTGTILS